MLEGLLRGSAEQVGQGLVAIHDDFEQAAGTLGGDVDELDAVVGGAGAGEELGACVE